MSEENSAFTHCPIHKIELPIPGGYCTECALSKK